MFYKTRTARLGLSALLAALGYGCWSFYINSRVDALMGLQSGLVHAAVAFTATLFFSGLSESLFSLFGKDKWAALLSFLMTCVVLHGYSIGINWINDTPALLLTVLPGILIGTTYTAGYCYLMVSSAGKAAAHS